MKWWNGTRQTLLCLGIDFHRCDEVQTIDIRFARNPRQSFAYVSLELELEVMSCLGKSKRQPPVVKTRSLALLSQREKKSYNHSKEAMMMLMNDVHPRKKFSHDPILFHSTTTQKNKRTRAAQQNLFSLNFYTHIVPSRVQHHTVSKRMYFNNNLISWKKQKMKFWINKE